MLFRCGSPDGDSAEAGNPVCVPRIGRKDVKMNPSEHSILVVEDEHSLRAVAARQLRQTFSQVLEADSVARALALLQTERVDAILVDIHLSDGSGFEILDALSRAGAAPAV